MNSITKPAIHKKVTKAYALKIDQLVLIKNHQKGPFDLTYIYNHQVVGIPNKSTVLLIAPNGKERKYNIHHVKPVSSLDITTIVTAHRKKFLQPHFNNSGTAFSRSQVLVLVFIAAITQSTCTTYSQKQRNHKYNFTRWKYFQ